MKSITIDFGIDLGTTNSKIAKIKGVETEVFKNNDGSEATPSAVWMDSKERVHVGRRAKDQLENDPENAFSEFKLQMGTETQYTFARNEKKMSPHELSSEVLKALKEDVRRQLGIDVTSVVITIPAAFGLLQCEATNKAAELAGFINHPLLQEPIAAAMAYGFQSEKTNKFWMIYNFGGGTFDASIIQIKDGQIEVINHGGDIIIGGKNLDWEIVNKLFAPVVAKENNLNNFYSNNKQFKGAFAKLKAEAEKAKIRLSFEDSVEIYIDNLFKNDKGLAVVFSYELFRNDFNELAKPYIIQSIDICKKLLFETRLITSNIEKIIMVGGTSLIPYLREMLLDPNEGLGIPLESSINPLTVVAIGAAIFAGTQRIPFTKDIEVQKDEFLLELDYQPVGPDSEPLIGGRLLTDSSVDFDDFTIEFVNKTVRPEWRSGKIGLSSEGVFISQLWAEKDKKNEFQIEFYDQTGVKYKTIPDKLIYTMGMVSAEAPLVHSIGIALAKNETIILLQKGVPLPAKSKIVLRTIKDFCVEQNEDFINIQLVECEYQPNENYNRFLGSIYIKADLIRANIPAGSEIEVSISIDSSRKIVAKTFIPILDEEFTSQFNLMIENASIQENISCFEESKDEHETLFQKVENESSTIGSKILKQIESENLIDEFNKFVRDGSQGFRTKLNNTDDSIVWPTLVNDTNKKQSPEVPTSRIDLVHFSVSSPPAVKPGKQIIVDVWAHLEQQRAEVANRVQQASIPTEVPPVIRPKGPFKIERGTMLYVRLKFQDLIVEPAEDVILWEGEIGNASFVVSVPAEVLKGMRIGSVTVHCAGGFQIARIPLQLLIADEVVHTEPIEQTLHRVRKAFVSYARVDLDEVLSRIQGMQKIMPDLDVFLDVVKLRSGEDWEKRLWSVIPESDVFYLFWSAAAKESTWVEKEWRCALTSRGADFIDPVPLVSPKDVPPPEELSKMHFNDWSLAYRRGKPEISM
jgi:molecular chaperone DnaK